MLKIFTNFNALFCFVFVLNSFFFFFAKHFSACKWSKKNVVCLFDLPFFLVAYCYKLI